LISVCSYTIEDSTLMSIFNQFCFSFVFLGCQTSTLIDIFKTPSGSISFNSLATMLPHRLMAVAVKCRNGSGDPNHAYLGYSQASTD